MGGVAHYVRERRLVSVHSQFTSAQRIPYLVRIAEEHSFKSAAHFSRAFKAQFGYTQTELIGSTPRDPIVHAPLQSRFSLPAWLSALR
jgi:AraC-like DNA-binding protein